MQSSPTTAPTKLLVLYVPLQQDPDTLVYKIKGTHFRECPPRRRKFENTDQESPQRHESANRGAEGCHDRQVLDGKVVQQDAHKWDSREGQTDT